MKAKTSFKAWQMLCRAYDTYAGSILLFYRLSLASLWPGPSGLSSGSFHPYSTHWDYFHEFLFPMRKISRRDLSVPNEGNSTQKKKKTKATETDLRRDSSSRCFEKSGIQANVIRGNTGASEVRKTLNEKSTVIIFQFHFGDIWWKNLTCWQMGSNNVISFLRKLFSSCKTCDKIVLWRE